MKVGALIGKQWDPLSSFGDVWEDSDEVEENEPLNFDESSSLERLLHL